jgi:hypothetical protein
MTIIEKVGYTLLYGYIIGGGLYKIRKWKDGRSNT